MAKKRFVKETGFEASHPAVMTQQSWLKKATEKSG